MHEIARKINHTITLLLVLPVCSDLVLHSPSEKLHSTLGSKAVSDSTD